MLVKKPKLKLPSFYPPVGKQLLNFPLLNARKEDFLKRTVCLLRALSFQAGLRSSRLNTKTLNMKHFSVVGRPINSAFLFIVLAKKFTFQIIEEALSTTIDSMTSMVNAGASQSTIRKQKMFVTLTNWIDQKQTRVAENKLFASKKYVPWNNLPDLPVARNIISQISIVQQYEQEKIARMIVNPKKRKTKFSNLS